MVKFCHETVVIDVIELSIVPEKLMCICITRFSEALVRWARTSLVSPLAAVVVDKGVSWTQLMPGCFRDRCSHVFLLKSGYLDKGFQSNKKEPTWKNHTRNSVAPPFRLNFVIKASSSSIER